MREDRVPQEMRLHLFTAGMHVEAELPHDRRFPTIIDENCWSDESFCRDNKVSGCKKSLYC